MQKTVTLVGSHKSILCKGTAATSSTKIISEFTDHEDFLEHMEDISQPPGFDPSGILENQNISFWVYSFHKSNSSQQLN